MGITVQHGITKQRFQKGGTLREKKGRKKNLLQRGLPALSPVRQPAFAQDMLIG